MNILDQPIVRLLFVAALPWLSAWLLTRRSRWSESRWLDISIRIQTALLAIIFSAQFAGGLGIYQFTEPWLAPLIYLVLTKYFATAKQDPASLTATAAPNSPCDILISGLALSMIFLDFGRLMVPSLVGAVKVVSDAPIYHLLFAAKWWVAGQIYWIPIPFGESAAPYFPANGDLWFMTLVGWTGNLALAKVGQVPFWFLAGWWIFQLCQRLGSSRTSSLVAASIWMTLTPLALFTFEANVDTIFAAWFIGSVLFYVEYSLRCHPDISGEKPQKNWLILIHSLLAAGLAWGTKAPGLVFIPPWILFVTVMEFRRNKNAGYLQNILGFITSWLISITPVLFWWGRNILETGNPLYPLPVEVGGITICEGWYGPDVMRQSPYYLPFSEWRAFVDQLLAVMDPRILPVVMIAMTWWSLSKQTDQRSKDRWVSWLALIGVVTVAIYWCFVPYRTQQRFFLHGLAVFGPILATFMDRFKLVQILTLILLVLHVTSPQGWPLAAVGREPDWDLSPLIPNSMPGLVPVTEIVIKIMNGDLNSIGLIIFVAGAVVSIWKFEPRWRLVFKCALVVCGTGFLMMIAADRAKYQKIGRGMKYPVFPDYERAWSAFDAVTKKQPRHIAYSGTNLAIYLMGADLKNSVEYVNCNSHPDWLPHDYHLAQPEGNRRWPDPRPTWERIGPDYAAWLYNLKSRKIDLIVVARANPMEGRLHPFDPMGFPIERSWMEQHPEQFTPVYGIRENDPEMRIYELAK
jgi:hypothetical protein